MLVEEPAPPPFYGAVWIGGFWVWHGTWVWDHGRWAEPPRPSYVWVHPYYENRGGTVIFITGHWGAIGVAFVPPPRDRYFEVERPLPGVVAGPPCIGPEGVFVPPPPGSRLGIIIPAPVGTAPAVVTSAPAVVNVGMRITNNVNSNNTTVVNNVTNVTNVTNITHVTIVAPASATATGQAVNTSVPAQAHLAAALPPLVKVAAPPPATQRPIPAFVRGRPQVALPPPQVVHAIVQAPPRRPIPPAAAPAPATPPVAAPMAPHPAPTENIGAPGSRESFDRRDRERAPNAAQPAPMVQPTPNTAAPRAAQPAPMVQPAPNTGAAAPLERPNERPAEHPGERRERIEPRAPNPAQPAVNPSVPPPPPKAAVNPSAPPPPPKAAVNPSAPPPAPKAAANPNVPAPAPKPAVPASAPRNPQNTQGATPPRKESPAGQPAGGEKRGAAEKQKQDEKQKEHEKEKERGER
jgi:hypothetical protein